MAAQATIVQPDLAASTSFAWTAGVNRDNGMVDPFL
jgi:hypothetical protein